MTGVHEKRDGSLPLIGVNTFLPKDHAGDITTTIELIRSTEGEKGQQIANVRLFQAARNNNTLPLPLAGEGRGEGLRHLQSVARDRKFEGLPAAESA